MYPFMSGFFLEHNVFYADPCCSTYKSFVPLVLGESNFIRVLFKRKENGKQLGKEA
jgi:hypothetical protein